MSYLHITFTDGSNPWLCYGDKEKLESQLKRWKRNYILDILVLKDGSMEAKATRKSEDTRFIAQLSREQRNSVRNHIRYVLKKVGTYDAESITLAMAGRVCDVYGNNRIDYFSQFV